MSSQEKIIENKQAAMIGRILLDSGRLSSEDADKILVAQKKLNLRFGDAAIKLGLLKNEDIEFALSQQFAYDGLPPNSEAIDKDIVVAFRSQTKELEEYRTLRSQLALGWFAENKSLVVSSVQREDGACYVSANLAVLFAQLGKRTLLVDANLRQPVQHKLFKLPNKSGLSDYLAGRATLDVTQRIQGFDNLHCLSSGTKAPNPQELLSHYDKWEELENHYDIIIIDTPPALDSADTQALLAYSSGTLLVAKSNKTKMNQIDYFKQQCQTARAEIVGVVLFNE